MSVDIGSIAMNNEPKTGLTDFSEKVVCFYRRSLSSSKNASVALQGWEGRGRSGRSDRHPEYFLLQRSPVPSGEKFQGL